MVDEMPFELPGGTYPYILEAMSVYKNQFLPDYQKRMETIKVHSNNCIGCLKTKTDIMLNYSSTTEHQIIHLFLMEKQAIELMEDLQMCLEDNKGNMELLEEKRKEAERYNDII